MREITLIEQQTDSGELELCSPRVGRFLPGVGAGDIVSSGSSLGVLKVMNTRYKLVAPHGVLGHVDSVSSSLGVAYGERLLVLSSLGALDPSGDSDAASGLSSGAAGGIEIVAPIDGIYYSRPSPDDPPFAEVGAELRLGQTVGLIEVMKTFNPVKLEGSGLPERVVVRAVLAKDQQEVAAGQVLLRVEPG